MSKKHHGSRKKEVDDAVEAEERAEALDTTALEERIVELEKQLGEAQAEAAEAADRAVRTLSEFNNFKRRSLGLEEKATAKGAADVLLDLLQLADDFDRALEHAGEDVPAGFLEGIRLVARRLHDLLDRHGVERIPAVGEVFDPNVHEAISMVPAAEGAAANTVVHEVQRGYRKGDRLLRAAQVVVTGAMQPQTAEGSDPEASADGA